MGLFVEARRLISFHIEMWKLRREPATIEGMLVAFDEACKRSPNSLFVQESRAIAELWLRRQLGVGLDA